MFFFSRESVEFLGREERWVQMVCRDLRVSQVHLVQMGQRYFTTGSPPKIHSEKFKALSNK